MQKKEGLTPAGDTCDGCHGNSRAREGRIASSVQRFAAHVSALLHNALTLLHLRLYLSVLCYIYVQSVEYNFKLFGFGEWKKMASM